MLAACTAGTVRINLQIVVIYFNIDVLLDIRHHITGSKRSLPFSRRIEWRNPDKTVDSLFGAQISVSVFSVHLERHALDPCHISFQIVQHFYAVIFLFGPPCIHPVKHVRPVAGFCPACSGMERNDRVISVIRSGKKRADAQFLKAGLELFQFFLYSRHRLFVGIFLTHLNEKRHILVVRVQLFNLFHRILKVFQFLHHLLGGLRVIPEPRLFNPFLQFFDP